MVVRTQLKGREISGLLLDAEDVRRHFPKHIKAVELQMGGLGIHCELTPEFWNGRPEISDRRLRDWLEFKVFHGRPCRLPLSLEMTPTGENCFMLQLPTDCDVAECSAPAEVAAACPAIAAAATSPAGQRAKRR